MSLLTTAVLTDAPSIKRMMAPLAPRRPWLPFTDSMTDSARANPTGAIPGLADVPIIGILRGCPPEDTVAVVSTAVEAGLRVVEVTLDSEDALGQIERLAHAVPEVTLGAGTVIAAAQVRQAISVGARFVVSPVVAEDVIAECQSTGVACIPGAATPTEVSYALRMGATAVKVFPAAQLGGPDYVRAIMGPLGDPPLVPTGGVKPEAAHMYIESGALAIGAGSDLFHPGALVDGDLATISATTKLWLESVG